MERTQIFDLMGEIKLYGMKAAFDEIMATAVKRHHGLKLIGNGYRSKSAAQFAGCRALTELLAGMAKEERRRSR